MTGKEKCEIFKKLRHDIAVENGIEPENRECTYNGECSGTCPACEADAQRIEKEIGKKKHLGLKAVVAGIAAAATAVSFTSCKNNQVVGDVPNSVPETEDESVYALEGDVAYFPDENDIDEVDETEENAICTTDTDTSEITEETSANE